MARFAGAEMARGARGVRLNPQHDDRTRAKIQTSQIINRLQNFVNGKVEMSPAQVTAALGLIRKTVPDLAAVELNGNLTVRNTVSPEMLTPEQWLERHGEPKRLDS